MSDNSIRIATWNVAYGRGPVLNARRREQLAAVRAHVWVLTETHDGLGPPGDYALIQGAQRPEFGAENRDVVVGSRWVSIWSSLPVLRPSIEVRDPERTVACLLDAFGVRLLVFGTVLPWTGDRERRMGSVLEQQEGEWLSLSNEYEAALCVAGDFNVDLGGGPHYYGSKESKRLVEQSLGRAGLALATGYDRTKAIQPEHGLVDHIALSESFASSVEVGELWGQRNQAGETMSDHHGVAVDIELRGESEGLQG